MAKPKASKLERSGSVIHESGTDDLTQFFSNPRGLPSVPLAVNYPGETQGCAWNMVRLQGHALTFGATRSGKGVSAIIPALLSYGGSAVVIDPKGENAWVTAERRRQMGQRVVILDPWGEVNRRYAKGQQVEQVTRFNPLSALRADDPDFADDVGAIADALIVAGDDLDSHWTNSARELVAGLIAAEVERKPPGQASLGAVRRLLTATDEEMAAEVGEIQKANPDSLAGRKLRRFTKDNTEVAGVRATAETQTAILDSARLLASMETGEPPFDLAELATGRVTLYLVLPPDRLMTHGRWLRLVLTLALRTISRQDTPPAVPVVLLLDEMGTISPGSGLAMIEQAFGLLAGLGVRVWGFFQDINQLQRDYPKSWETFIANSAMIQILNARDPSTSEYVSRYCGEMILSYAPVSFGPGASVPGVIEKHPTLPPDRVRMLGGDETLVIYPGLGIVRAKRIPYHEEPRFWGMYRPLPGFQQTSPPPQPKPRDRRPADTSSPMDVATMVGRKAFDWIDEKLKARK